MSKERDAMVLEAAEKLRRASVAVHEFGVVRDVLKRQLDEAEQAVFDAGAAYEKAFVALRLAAIEGVVT